ncbi:globin-coupled sensor protein [Novosphingobium profundi]|uniref:methyl-accepting chemotaxis protein n=1 Tax=Novosphingobium profundi TaxID=1774954 RepID=UPI001BD97547|nr:globin-coupled sensor protein [Novosphingobium profundi]MBT0667983.1 globin-coupled sensor protein [Novosphingobium profundi]
MSLNALDAHLEFIEFTAAQRKTLVAAQPFLSKAIVPALDRFYARARKTPATAAMFRDNAHMEKARTAQIRHWMNLSNATFDAAYVEAVRRIGKVHATIGLEPRWYIGSYSLIIEELLRAVDAQSAPWKRLVGLAPNAGALRAVLVKAALLDMQLSISVYFEEAEAERAAAIAALDTALSDLAQGNLTRDVDGLPDSFESLARSFNRSLGNLRQTIATVIDTAGTIQTGTGEIASATEDLARRTESNAASLEEVTSTLQSIEALVRTTASGAQETLGLASGALSATLQGRDAAVHAGEAMGQVQESARGIDTVIEGLDKIAFQTRVLAMNAAVEAGRAGEAGRGFAVVADLVSALAMRSEEEAHKARTGLSTTRSEIEQAASAVFAVSRELEALAHEVEKVHTLINTMARDNEAQASAISQINTAMGQMDETTHRNAAMVEQTSAAVHSLSSDATRLAAQAQTFRIESESPVAQRAYA